MAGKTTRFVDVSEHFAVVKPFLDRHLLNKGHVSVSNTERDIKDLTFIGTVDPESSNTR